MRLLLIEDDDLLRTTLKADLERAGYAVDAASDGTQGEFLGATEHYDVAVLDLGLPGVPGLEVLRRWRAAGIGFPVLVLTARGLWHERVEGLKAGADDYLGKPFHLEELLARLQALLRRGPPQETRLRCAGIEVYINRLRRRLGRDLIQTRRGQGYVFDGNS